MYVVLPQIRDAWAATGWERGELGLPRSDTFCGLRDGGCGQHFRGGSIYWSPGSGAHVVRTDLYRTDDRIARFWQ